MHLKILQAGGGGGDRLNDLFLGGGEGVTV